MLEFATKVNAVYIVSSCWRLTFYLLLESVSYSVNLSFNRNMNSTNVSCRKAAAVIPCWCVGHKKVPCVCMTSYSFSLLGLINGSLHAFDIYNWLSLSWWRAMRKLSHKWHTFCNWKCRYNCRVWYKNVVFTYHLCCVIFNSSAGTRTFTSCETSDAGRRREHKHGCEENANSISGDACWCASILCIRIFICAKPSSESSISA